MLSASKTCILISEGKEPSYTDTGLKILCEWFEKTLKSKLGFEHAAIEECRAKYIEDKRVRDEWSAAIRKELNKQKTILKKALRQAKEGDDIPDESDSEMASQQQASETRP